jgi:hypothetical protein
VIDLTKSGAGWELELAYICKGRDISKKVLPGKLQTVYKRETNDVGTRKEIGRVEEKTRIGSQTKCF